MLALPSGFDGTQQHRRATHSKAIHQTLVVDGDSQACKGFYEISVAFDQGNVGATKCDATKCEASGSTVNEQ